MQVDITLMEKDLRLAGDLAASAERSGHHGVWCTETGVDPFLQAYEAVRRTSRVQVGTAIAVALARNPMTVAYSAWNLAAVSDGRFVLGLGSQVKAHVERRYSMPWRSAVGQMREFVEATRAIFTAWRTGERLDFRGEHYTHTLMSPFWEPAAHTHEIPVHVAAVGPKMTRMAGTVADGVLLHTFTNAAYLEKVAFPALDEGMREAGRGNAVMEMSIPLFMVMGDTEEEIAQRREQTARQLAFYASTPAYRPVLEAIGQEDLQPELTAMSKRGEWEAMSSLITDDLLAHFAVVGTPEQMPALARRHLGPRVTRATSYFGWPVEDKDRLRQILADFNHEKDAA